MDITIDRNIYSDACISKAIYSLSSEYVINRSLDGMVETLHVRALTDDNRNAEEDVLTALNDYRLRQIIEDETHDIRTILYAKAFAEFDDIDEDEEV